MMVHVTTPECTVCGSTSEMFLNKTDLQSWWEGSYIQDAFPYLTADERELLITGIHPHCWDIIFGDDDG